MTSHKRMEQLRYCAQFVKYTVTRFINDGGFYRASALTYTSLLALVPLMVVALSVLSAFPVFQSLGDDVQEVIFANFVPSTGQTVKAYLLTFMQSARQLSMVGVVFLLVTAVMMLFTIEQAFNNLWRVSDRRSGIYLFILYWAILTLSPFIIGLGIAANSYIITLPLLNQLASALGLTALLAKAVSFAFECLFFSLLYITIPNCQVPIRYGIGAGVFAAVCFDIAKHGFAFYITQFPTYQLIYGALATVPVFLIWLYLLWLIILFGAEVSCVLTFRFRINSHYALDGFNHAIRWLGHLWQAQQNNQGLSLLALTRRDRCNYEVEPELMIDHLEQAGYVFKSDKGTYRLARNLSEVSVFKIHQALPWKCIPTNATDNNWEQSITPLVNTLQDPKQSALDKSLSDCFTAYVDNDACA